MKQLNQFAHACLERRRYARPLPHRRGHRAYADVRTLQGHRSELWQELAIKAPNPEMESDPVLLQRFRREEQIRRQLDHPGIVKAFNGEERSRIYVVIEWVDRRLLPRTSE